MEQEQTGRTAKINFTLEDREKKAVRRAAADNDLSMSSFIREICINHPDVKRRLFFADGAPQKEHTVSSMSS